MFAFGPAWKAALVFALLSFAAPAKVSGKRTRFSEDSRHLRRRRRSQNNLKLDGNRIDLITPYPLSLPNSGDVAAHIPFVTPTPTQTKVWSPAILAPSLKASLNSPQVPPFPYATPNATLYEAPSITPLSSLPPAMPLPTPLSPSLSDPSSEARLRRREKRGKRLNKKFMRVGKAEAKSVFAESDGALSVMTGVTDTSPSFLIDFFLQHLVRIENKVKFGKRLAIIEMGMWGKFREVVLKSIEDDTCAWFYHESTSVWAVCCLFKIGSSVGYCGDSEWLNIAPPEQTEIDEMTGAQRRVTISKAIISRQYASPEAAMIINLSGSVDQCDAADTSNGCYAFCCDTAYMGTLLLALAGADKTRRAENSILTILLSILAIACPRKTPRSVQHRIYSASRSFVRHRWLTA